MMHTQKQKGFTLIELIMVIVLIGIVAATAVMVIGNIVTQQQFDATVKEMNELKMAALGNPDLVQSGARSSFGYVGDMGALPTGNTLQPLVFMTTPPTWVATSAYHAATFPTEPTMPDLGTGAGWRGPYIDNKTDDAGTTYLATLDGWGNDYIVATYSGTGQVTSTGGGAGNITIPETSVAGKITGNVSGTIRGNLGSTVQGAMVRIYYPNTSGSGLHTTQQTTSAAGGTYSFSNIPIGRRTIRVMSGATLPCAAADANCKTINDTVVVEGGGTVTKDITIADMIAPDPPTNVTGTLSGCTLNLTWTSSVSADTVSYKIYRCVTNIGIPSTPGCFSLLASNVTTQPYPDALVTANQDYHYKMTAVDAAGNESTTFSAEYTYSYAGMAAPTWPANPFTTLTACPANLTMTWNNYAGASSYKLYRCVYAAGGACGAGYTLYQSGLPTNSYTDTALSTDTTGWNHSYQVSAVVGACESAQSSAQTADVDPVYMVAGSACIPFSTCGGDNRFTFNIRQNSGAAVTLTGATITWTGGTCAVVGGCSFRDLRIGGTTVYNPGCPSGIWTPATITFTTTYSLANATSTQVRIRWCDNWTTYPSPITIQWRYNSVTPLINNCSGCTIQVYP